MGNAHDTFNPAEMTNPQDAPTVSEWISVKDRLPKNGTYVLYYDINYGNIDKSLYDYDSFLNSSKAFHNITHWMPLPNAPEVN